MIFSFKRAWPAWMVLCAGVLATLLTAYAVKRDIDEDSLRAIVADAAAAGYWAVWAVLAGGFALSGLVFALLLSLRHTSARADRIAGELTREIGAGEHLLRESEHRWKFAVQSSGDVIWDKDLVKNTTFRSAGWKQMLGYAEDELGEGGGSWEQHIHPEERPRIVAALYAFLDGKTESFALDYRVVCKDGGHKWIFSRGAVVAYGADGRPARAIGTHSDVTARRQAERSLRLARISIDAAYDALFWVTADTRIVDVNEAACRLYGYTREELLQLKTSDISPENNRRSGIWAERFAEIGRRGSMKFETTHRTKDGRSMDVEVSANRVQLDGQDFNCAFVRDITARKLAEQALRLAQTSLDAASDSLMWVNAQGRIVEVNAAACRLLGYAREEFLQLGILDINPGSPGGLEQWKKRFAEFREHGFAKFETEHRARDGKMIPVEIVSNHVLIGGGELSCAFIRDISERKKIEARLSDAVAAAEQANHAKSRFLAAASHDLRQPLAALSLYVGTLKNQRLPGNEAVLGNIGECVNSLNELLADLLDVSKLEAGVVTPSVTEFAIDDLLARLVTVHAAEAALKGLQLRLRHSGTGARTDAQLYQRIVGNLLSNAIRYTRTGGVLVACRRHRGRHWVEIWDTGSGIARQDIDIIFEEFRQLGDAARNRGSGLGLAIVAKSAILLGLQTRVCSRPGRGSMFAIELPAGRALKAAASQPARPAARSLTIGLVEDHSQVRNALTLALEAAGHVVFPAGNGAELLAGLGDQAPDILVADYRLAGSETGFEAIAAVRAVFGASLPAIVITGDTDPDLIRGMARQDIAVHYKPLQLEVLEDCVRNAANQAR